jgi:exopolysaccharide/PEP-CTERM locus tyrosine autokinase
MSKIAKALLKSQQTQNPATPATDCEVPGSPGKVVYTQSKVMNTPDAHLERHRIAAFLDDPVAMDHFNILRTQILQRTRDKCWNSIMVTSPGPGDGKTLTAINLAVSIAREVQQTALLVDMNLRSPKLCDYLGLTFEKGLTDYLLGRATADELFINPGIEKLLVLPAGHQRLETSELLGSPRMMHLVKELKNRYPDRYVLFDCPHIVHMPDSQIFSEYVDCILMVVRANRTSRDDMAEAMRLLQGRELLGTVVNDYAA